MVCLVGVKGGRCEVRVQKWSRSKWEKGVWALALGATIQTIQACSFWHFLQKRHVGLYRPKYLCIFYAGSYFAVLTISSLLDTTSQFHLEPKPHQPPIARAQNYSEPNSRRRLPPGPLYRLPPAAQRSPSNPPQRPVPAPGKSRHGQETAAQGRQQFCRRDSARRRVVSQPRQVPRPSRRARAALLEPAVALAVANALVLSRPQDINNHHPDPPQSRQ